METWREELYANELYHYGVKGMKWHVRKGINGAATKGVSTILGGAHQVINSVDKDHYDIGGSFLDRNRRYAQNKTRHQKRTGKVIKNRTRQVTNNNAKAEGRGRTSVRAIRGSNTVRAGIRAVTNLFKKVAKQLTGGKVTNT